MKRTDKAFLATLLAILGLTLVANGTVAIKDEWLDWYSNACGPLVAAAENCSLCHSSGFALNPYGFDMEQYGSLIGIELMDSDEDGVTNRREVFSCSLPGDPGSTSPIDNVSWSGIKALYH